MADIQLFEIKLVGMELGGGLIIMKITAQQGCNVQHATNRTKQEYPSTFVSMRGYYESIFHPCVLCRVSKLAALAQALITLSSIDSPEEPKYNVQVRRSPYSADLVAILCDDRDHPKKFTFYMLA
jgi:hypothetical protein